ncbi:hypothetical protein GGI12_003707 [Dipsacomyces acuminosporus]|nr:hypothetical protein GGI12_003707 [Dipsacomyces acuminosporus]
MAQLVFLGKPLPSWVSTRSGVSLLVKATLAISALAAILFSSVTLYGIFYRLYVPRLMHEAPVYLQYQSPTSISANISLVPRSNYKFLSASQAYSVSLLLDVPTSDTNQALGNFMVSLDLCSRSGDPVRSSSRPSILPYRSSLVKAMHTAVNAVPLLLRLSKEATTLHVELMDDLYDKHSSPITNARISLSKPLQVYTARIVFLAEFSGLRYWMYYWRVPTAIVFIAIAVMWQLLFTVISWSVLETYTRSRLLPPLNSQRSTHAERGSHAGSDLIQAVDQERRSADGAPRLQHDTAMGSKEEPKDSIARSLTPSLSAQPRILGDDEEARDSEQEVPGSETIIDTPDPAEASTGSLRRRQSRHASS